MPNPKPFPIYDLKAGKITARDPWLLPQDGFETLRNAHILDGVLEKRRGYVEYGEIEHTDTSDGTTDTNPGNPVMAVGNYIRDNTKYLIAMDSDRLNEWDTGTSAFIDATRNKIRIEPTGYAHTPVVGNTCTGAISGATAEIESIIVDQGSWAGSDAVAWIIFVSGSQAVGTFQNNELVHDGTGNIGTTDGAVSDHEFTLNPTGVAADYYRFFHIENWDNVAYLTNGKTGETIYRYMVDDAGTNTQVVPMYIDLDVEGGPDNDVTGVLLAFAFKGRLLLLSTVERQTEYRQRARWSDINDLSTWPDANYVDCPVRDNIEGAHFLGEELIVFFRSSTWKLIYTGDSDLPFQWFRVSDTKGCEAGKSIVPVEDNLLTCVSNTGLIGVGSRQAFALAPKIRTFPLGFNLDLAPYDYSLPRPEQLQVWTTYTSATATAPDSILVGTYTPKGSQYEWSWSTYDIPAHCLGAAWVEGDLMLEDITDVLDTLDYSFDDADRATGHPITMIGSIDGYIYQAHSGGNDDGSDIELEIKTGRMNPYKDHGVETRLHWVDFLCDADDNISFSVIFYVDWETSSYLTHTVTLDGGVGGGKVWKRVQCNCVGQAHQIEISHTASAQPVRIHAMVPYFTPSRRAVR